MLYRVQGALLGLLGAGSVVEAWRITQEVREAGNFDAIGPDRYLMGLGVLMAVIGLWMALRPPAADQFGSLPAQRSVGATFCVTVGLTAALALALPYIGFAPASFLFLTIMFRHFGEWSWLRSAAASAATAGVFYVVFIWLADLPLPHGELLF